jgi:hypothetical protein
MADTTCGVRTKRGNKEIVYGLTVLYHVTTFRWIFVWKIWGERVLHTYVQLTRLGSWLPRYPLSICGVSSSIIHLLMYRTALLFNFSKNYYFFLLPLFFLRFTLACIPGSFKDDRNITSKSYDLHTKIERENVKFDKESLPKKVAWTVWIITKHSKEKKHFCIRNLK